jgi:hypothetical protein
MKNRCKKEGLSEDSGEALNIKGVKIDTKIYIFS